MQFILAVAHIYVLLTSENIGKYSFLNLKKKIIYLLTFNLLAQCSDGSNPEFLML